MSDYSSKFNPASLPAEFMEKFEPAKTKDPKHFLYPGQVFVSAKPIVISTILGSCAAVCLWDRHKKVGGMNHYLLPEGPNEGPNRLRYGMAANQELLTQLKALGCEVRNLQAKIYGGSCAFGADPGRSLGSRNVELAERFLRTEGIAVIEKEVSGKRGRRLAFRTDDGTTVVKNFEQTESASAGSR